MTLGAGMLDDARIERLLMLSGKRVRLLADEQLLRVRAALIAENSRLASAARRVASSDAQTTSDKPVNATQLAQPPYTKSLLRTFAAAAFSAALVCAYIIFGGARASVTGTLSGEAIILETRTGLFGWTWQMARGKHSMTDAALRLGDEIVASTPLRLKLTDGVELVAEPGAHFKVLASGNGLHLHRGVINGSVAPGAGFTLSHAAGSMTSKDARFSVDADARMFSVAVHQGSVIARNDRQRIDVVTGEYARVMAGEALFPELQTPRVLMPEDPQHQLLSASSKAAFDARISPNGTLIALDKNGSEFGRYQADVNGLVRGEIAFDRPGRLALRFLQEDSNAARRSALSDPLEITYDPAALLLRVTRARRDRDQIMITGATSPGAQIRVNGVEATVAADGRFEARVAAQPNSHAVEIIATDRSGAQMRVLQMVE